MEPIAACRYNPTIGDRGDGSDGDTSGTKGLLVAGLLLWIAAATWGEVRDPNGVAVIVGNRTYEHERLPEAPYAHRDAAAFKRYVTDVLGYDPLEFADAHRSGLGVRVRQRAQPRRRRPIRGTPEW